MFDKPPRIAPANFPKVSTQGNKNAVLTMATRVTRLVGADYLDIQSLANETGGEVCV